MIAEIFLGLSNIAVIVAFILYVKEQRGERQRLVNALIAKSAQELTNLTFAENTKITPDVAKPDPDLVDMSQLSDEQFDAHIQKTLGNQIEDQEVV